MSVWLAFMSVYLVSVRFHLTVGCPGTGVIDGVSYKYVLRPVSGSSRRKQVLLSNELSLWMAVYTSS